jgi:hypothetical protein
METWRWAAAHVLDRVGTSALVGAKRVK